MALTFDIPTIRALLRHADARQSDAEAYVRKYDNSEAMHDSEAWAMVGVWLRSIIADKGIEESATPYADADDYDSEEWNAP